MASYSYRNVQCSIVPNQVKMKQIRNILPKEIQYLIFKKNSCGDFCINAKQHFVQNTRKNLLILIYICKSYEQEVNFINKDIVYESEPLII